IVGERARPHAAEPAGLFPQTRGFGGVGPSVSPEHPHQAQLGAPAAPTRPPAERVPRWHRDLGLVPAHVLVEPARLVPEGIVEHPLEVGEGEVPAPPDAAHGLAARPPPAPTPPPVSHVSVVRTPGTASFKLALDQITGRAATAG